MSEVIRQAARKRLPTVADRAVEMLTITMPQGLSLDAFFTVAASTPYGRTELGSSLHTRQPFSSPFSSTVSSSFRWTITATRTEYDFLRSFLSLPRQRAAS